MNNIQRILKKDLKSPSEFREKVRDNVQRLKKKIQEDHNIDFDEEELNELLLSACRSNEFDIIYEKKNKMFLVEDRVLNWVEKKLLPNTVVMKLDDEDVVRLLIFSIEITYQMFAGGTKATVTAKGFRERRRTFESILVDQFVGKLGEVMTKKFLEDNFPQIKIELDWDISRQIEKYRNDIINAEKNVSIKSSPTLTGVWAEADIGYDYGIAVKSSTPQPTILQFFVEVCGFLGLLNFGEEKIPSHNSLFKDYLKKMRNRVKDYKCGEIQTDLKGFICGYFKTSECVPIKEGTDLPYLGTVREKRYLIPIKELKHTKEDWREFLREVGLL